MTFKIIIQCLVIASFLSCNLNKTKEKNSNLINNVSDTSNNKKRDSSQNRASSKTLDYEKWDTFWKSFSIATKKKDTATIIELTNFPFYQNSYPAFKDEFIKQWISQTFDLRITDTAVPSSAIILQIQKSDNGEMRKFDSVRYAHKTGIDFYFAKVNGFYRLVEIITPG